MWVIYWGKDSYGGNMFEVNDDAAADFIFPDNPTHDDVLKFNSMREAQRYLCKHYHDCAAADIIHIGLAHKLYKEWKQSFV